MANSDTPFGLKPVRHRNGAPFNGAGSLYYVPSSYGTAVFPGDPVVVTGTADASGIAEVNVATAGDGNSITGVVIGRTNGDGVLLADDSLELPASTGGYLLVADDPDVVFEVQASGSVAATDISNNANLASGTGSAGVSGWEMGASAALATSQIKVLRLVRREGNALGANAKVEVMINNHTQAHNTAGV